jgi:phospholipid/cholesterol/gamma-HCH transport system substrate-binding protein
VALAVVTVLGFYFIVFDVMRYRIGTQRFTVSVQMAAAGGLYPGAEVTYRGVVVGNVASLRLGTDGLVAKIGINPGTHIPSNATAHVRDLSALGEQYLDLDPSSGVGPYLRQGSVVPADRVTVPVPIGSTLVDLGNLVGSIDPANLRTVETLLTVGFTGTERGLRHIVVTGQKLFNALVAARADTTDLIVDGQPVLQTARATDSDFAEYTAGLQRLTAQLKSSGSDIHSLISNGVGAEDVLNPFLASNERSITQTIDELGNAAGVASAYQPEVQALFQLLPVITGELAQVTAGGVVHGQFSFNTADTVCPYVPAAEIPGPTERITTPALDNGCAHEAPDLLQRGADAAPVVANP